MCVIVAAKLPRDRKTGKPLPNAKWRLAKIRDRTYDAEYSVRRYTVKENGASQLFLIDTDTDWTEGISVHADGSMFMMVNAALNNKDDKKDDGTRKAAAGDRPVANNGKSIRYALKDHTIESAIEILRENKFDGNTFLSDGNRLFVMEMNIPAKVKEKYRSEIEETGKRFGDIVPLEEFEVVIKEVKNEWLVVRTNSGQYNKEAGYVPEDGKNYRSSKLRRDYTIKAIEERVYEPIDLIDALSKLGEKSVDKNPWFRPIRVKGKDLKDDEIDIYTTSIMQMDPNGTFILQPVNCKINNYNVNTLTNEKYLANLVILPKIKKDIFESFKRYSSRRSIRLE